MTKELEQASENSKREHRTITDDLRGQVIRLKEEKEEQAIQSDRKLKEALAELSRKDEELKSDGMSLESNLS